MDGKTIFIEGALPGERVSYISFKKKKRYELARLETLYRESAIRVTPECAHFGVCGGCSQQHVEARAQVAVKQRTLEDALWHVGRVRPDVLYPPIYGGTLGYRHRARLSVKQVDKKGGLLIGFHERRSSYVANMHTCKILVPHVSALIEPLRTLISSLTIFDQLPQIEVAVGENATALALRILVPLTPADFEKLRAFAQQHRVQFWLQESGPASLRPAFADDAQMLYYTLPEFGVRLAFRPNDFTQVNFGINRVMVRRAMQLLAPQAGERIADMFCGLGNFTLPIAASGAQVLGVEGSRELVERANENARMNQLEDRVSYSVANLFEIDAQELNQLGKLDKMLIDPPREGALALVQALGELGPKRIVYVSCDPATLARDAGVLVNERGYRMRGAGVINMFPHTSHVESIALFERS